ncbi:MAG: ArsR/SmtB family transcription factor [Bacilli bacterium]
MKLLDEDKIIDLSELFKIFGDSTRVKIINILLDEELCVGDIAEKISATQSAVSHQLRILKSSKLVKYRKVGNTVFYSLDDHHIKEIFEKGCEHINEI